MKDKTVTIHKTTAIGQTQFTFTSGMQNPLLLDVQDQRFFVVEGQKSGQMLAQTHPGDVVVVPPNQELWGERAKASESSDEHSEERS